MYPTSPLYRDLELAVEHDSKCIMAGISRGYYPIDREIADIYARHVIPTQQPKIVIPRRHLPTVIFTGIGIGLTISVFLAVCLRGKMFLSAILVMCLWISSFH